MTSSAPLPAFSSSISDNNGNHHHNDIHREEQEQVAGAKETVAVVPNNINNNQDHVQVELVTTTQQLRLMLNTAPQTHATETMRQGNGLKQGRRQRQLLRSFKRGVVAGTPSSLTSISSIREGQNEEEESDNYDGHEKEQEEQESLLREDKAPSSQLLLASPRVSSSSSFSFSGRRRQELTPSPSSISSNSILLTTTTSKGGEGVPLHTRTNSTRWSPFLFPDIGAASAAAVAAATSCDPLTNPALSCLGFHQGNDHNDDMDGTNNPKETMVTEVHSDSKKQDDQQGGDLPCCGAGCFVAPSSQSMHNKGSNAVSTSSPDSLPTRTNLTTTTVHTKPDRSGSVSPSLFQSLSPTLPVQWSSSPPPMSLLEAVRSSSPVMRCRLRTSSPSYSSSNSSHKTMLHLNGRSSAPPTLSRVQEPQEAKPTSSYTTIQNDSLSPVPFWSNAIDRAASPRSSSPTKTIGRKDSEHGNNQHVDDINGSPFPQGDHLLLLGPSSSARSSIRSPQATPLVTATEVLPQQLLPLVDLPVSSRRKNDGLPTTATIWSSGKVPVAPESMLSTIRTTCSHSPPPAVTPVSPRGGSSGRGCIPPHRRAWLPYLESSRIDDDKEKDEYGNNLSSKTRKGSNCPSPTGSLSRGKAAEAHRRRVVEHILNHPPPCRHLSQVRRQEEEQQEPISSPKELESRLALLSETHSSISYSKEECSEDDNDNNENNHRDCSGFTATDQLLDRMAQFPLVLNPDKDYDEEDSGNNTHIDEELILLDLGRGHNSDDGDDVEDGTDNHEEPTIYFDESFTQQQHDLWDRDIGDYGDREKEEVDDDENNDADGKDMGSKYQHDLKMVLDLGDDDDAAADEAGDSLLPPPQSTISTTFHGTFFTHVMDEDEDDTDTSSSSSSSFPTTNGSESEMHLLDIQDLEDEDDDDDDVVHVYSNSATSSFYQHRVTYPASPSSSVSLVDNIHDAEEDEEHDGDGDYQIEERTIDPCEIPQSPDRSDNSDEDGRIMKQYFVAERVRDSTLTFQFPTKALNLADDIISPTGAEHTDNEPWQASLTPTEDSVSHTNDFSDDPVESSNQNTVITATPPLSVQKFGESDQNLLDEKKEDDQCLSTGTMGISPDDNAHNGPRHGNFRDQQHLQQGVVNDYRLTEGAKPGGETEALAGSVLGGHRQRVGEIGPGIERQQKIETDQQKRPRSETKGFLQDTTSEIGGGDDYVRANSFGKTSMDSIIVDLEAIQPPQQPEVALKPLESSAAKQKLVEPPHDEVPSLTPRLLDDISVHWQRVVGAESPAACAASPTPLSSPQTDEQKETPRGSNPSSGNKAEKTNDKEKDGVDMPELDTPPRVGNSLATGLFDELPTVTFTTAVAPVVGVIETQVDFVLQDVDSCASSTSSVKSCKLMILQDRSMEIRTCDEKGELVSAVGTSNGDITFGLLDEDTSSFYTAINSLNNSSLNSSTVVSLNSQEPPRKQARRNSQAMVDVQMIGETTFVSSSPVLLPQEPPSVEPVEDEDQSYSNDSSKGESTITQEGSISSSGTISSSASSTINTLQFTNSSPGPVEETKQDEDEEMVSSSARAPSRVLLQLKTPQKKEQKETQRGSNRSIDEKPANINGNEEREVGMPELNTPPSAVKSIATGFFGELQTVTFTATMVPVVESQVICVLLDVNSSSSCASSVKSYGFMTSEDQNLKNPT